MCDFARYDEFRPDLTLAYMLDFAPGAGLRGLEMVPFRLRKFRLERVHGEAAAWLAGRMNRECRQFRGRVELAGDETLKLTW